MWNYKLTLKFHAKIKEQFVTYDIKPVTESREIPLAWTQLKFSREINSARGFPILLEYMGFVYRNVRLYKKWFN